MRSMREKAILIGLCGLLSLALPFGAVSQSGYADSVKMIKNELKTYQAQLEKIDQDLVTYADYELYSSTYRDCVERMDIYYEANKSFIALECPALFDIWSDIKDLREEMDKKIETMRQASEAEARVKELEVDFTQTMLQYERWNITFQQLGQMKRKAAHDTLVTLKNRDAELYTEYATKQIQNKEIITQNPSLDSLCNCIETYHKTISEAQTIETIKWGDVIFKVTIVSALLAFLINLVVSKKKLNNQLNGKKKKKHIPSI